MLNAYGIKFRNKGSKEYIHGIFFAKDEISLAEKLETFIKEDDCSIDKRTLTWAGVCIPLSRNGSPIFIHGDIEELGD